MSIARTHAGTQEYPLSAEQTGRVLEQAQRRRATVRLTPSADPEGPSFLGRMAVVGTSSLWVEGEIDPESESAPSPQCGCDGQLKLGADLYLFTTTLRASRHSAAGVRLEISRPPNLSIPERRRAHRDRLSPGSPVTVRPVTDDVHPAFEATLFNVCADGLACCATLADAAALDIGTNVVVRFSVADDDPFEFAAELRSKTPARSPGRVILGVRFSNANAYRQDRRRLGVLLQPEGVS